MSNLIHLNVKSHCAWNPISQLVEEAYGNEISIFDYQIGRYMPLWYHAKRGDEVVYSIDDINICNCEISYIKHKAFRPRWVPDNENFNVFIDFTYSFCRSTFDIKWLSFMKSQHTRAIDAKRWMFAATVKLEPIFYYVNNKSIIENKVKEVLAYEDEMARTESSFFMGDLIDD